MNRHAMAVGLLLAVHAGLLAYGAWVHSPTYDEPAHLASGMSHWRFGRFELYRVNPPLVRMVAALPVLAAGARNEWTSFPPTPRHRSEFTTGGYFVKLNYQRLQWLFALARWACIPFSLLGGLVCYVWARELYGAWCGYVALTLWCFEPNILGHGQLITPDVASASLGVLAAYRWWRWLKEPSWLRGVESALTLGLMLLAKTTWIIALVLWPLLWFWFLLAGPSSQAHRPQWKSALQAAAIIAGGLLVLNIGYGFEGSGTPLGQFDFYSQFLSGRSEPSYDGAPPGNRFQGSVLGGVPLPFPSNYVHGIDIQKYDFERSRYSYLRGQFAQRGWWYYYLYGLAVKVPLGTLALVAVSLGLMLHRAFRASWRDEVFLLVPAVAVLSVVSSETEFTNHLRYVLPAVPFLLMSASKVGRVFLTRPLIPRAAVALAWAGSVASSLVVYPHSLSYFHELAGGPRSGHHHLLDSNIDWGQDLWYLRDWISAHPEARPIAVAYFGSFTPHEVGMDYAEVPRLSPSSRSEASRLTPGWYAISVNWLYGYGLGHFLQNDHYGYFRHLEPVAMAGYSIYIFHVTPADIERLRDTFFKVAGAAQDSSTAD
jgi:hypothetical protein